METVLEPNLSLVSFEPRTSTRRNRNYSDGEKAKALITLDLCGGNLSKASRETGVPITTLKDWNDGKITNDITEARNETKQSLASLCEQAAYEFIAQARATVDSSKGTQAATGAAIFIDKMRLLNGESTVNIAVSNHAQILHNWISTNQPNTQEIEQAIEATSDNNGYSAQELRDQLQALQAQALD